MGTPIRFRGSAAARYTAAIALVLLAAAGRWVLHPILTDKAPYVTFYVATIVAAWYLGLRAALVTAVLGSVAALYFFMPPYFSWATGGIDDWIWIGFYFLVSGVGMAAIESQRRATARASSAACLAEQRLRQIEQEIEQRKLAEKETERQRRWAEQTLSSIGDAVIATDTEGRLTFLNSVAEDLTGWKREDALGQPVARVFDIINELTRHAVGNPVERVLREGRIVGLANHTVLRARNGRETPIDDSAAPIRDEAGEISGTVLVFRDVTERKRAEESMRQANEDLQQFAYAASHDLQEPLRMVVTYSQLLERKCGASLDAAGRQYIKFAVEGALRIERLLSSLNEYWRLSGDRAPAPIDLNRAFETATGNLRAAIQESGASIVSGHLPVVLAEETPMVQLLQNLLSNAIKYRDVSRTLSIQVSAEAIGGYCQVSVIDNGVGIDPAYHRRVFQIFKRLHNRTDSLGTGIGLALCQKIVDRYGGRIWVDSKDGEGAAFRFTLPLEEGARCQSAQ